MGLAISQDVAEAGRDTRIAGVSREEVRKWYGLMHLSRVLDDKAPNYLKQGLGWSYHAPCAGHDAIQLALGMTFRPGRDYLFPYYRDLATCVAAGMTAEEILLNGMSKATDVASGGRHMSNHFAKPSIGIQNVSSCVSNHSQHAAGLARAIKTYRKDAIVFCSIGESSTSEGYFYEAVNGASREKLPVVFVVQDNAYGISVPKSDQTANLYASDNFAGFKNLKIIHCDGLDVFDSLPRDARGRPRTCAPAPVPRSCTRPACESTRTPTPTATSSTARPRSSPRRRPRIPCPASAACCSRPGSCPRRTSGAIETQNERTYEEAADAAKRRRSRIPRRSTTFWCPSRGSRRPGRKGCPTAPARR